MRKVFCPRSTLLQLSHRLALITQGFSWHLRNHSPMERAGLRIDPPSLLILLSSFPLRCLFSSVEGGPMLLQESPSSQGRILSVPSQSQGANPGALSTALSHCREAPQPIHLDGCWQCGGKERQAGGGAVCLSLGCDLMGMKACVGARSERLWEARGSASEPISCLQKGGAPFLKQAVVSDAPRHVGGSSL